VPYSGAHNWNGEAGVAKLKKRLFVSVPQSEPRRSRSRGRWARFFSPKIDRPQNGVENNADGGLQWVSLEKGAPSHLIPVSPDNAASNDWVVLLEAGTIVGPSPDRLRVAKSTLEKKIVKRYNFFLRATHFLDVEGYDPRIHAVYFCPQLYKYDPDKKLVPLQGEEIGKLIAQALASGVKARRPWYEPSEKLPTQPVVNAPKDQFDTLVVDMASARELDPTDKKSLSVVENRD
jgi:hypothetical protein